MNSDIKEAARHVPYRRCCGCMQRFPKAELLRLCTDKEGKLFIDETQKADGRGAYLCGNAACLEKAIKKRSINRTLRRDVSEQIITMRRCFNGD